MDGKGCTGRCLLSLFVVLASLLCGRQCSALDRFVEEAVPSTIGKIDVSLEIGHYVHIKDLMPIKVYQFGLDNPYRTYRGCGDFTIRSNFSAILSVSAQSVGKVGGEWRAEIGPHQYARSWIDSLVVHEGLNDVRICVQGSDVDISQFRPSPGMKVAEVRVSIVPF